MRLVRVTMKIEQQMSFGLALLIAFLSVCNARVIKTKVAILGGGMAGVTAARTLSENGITNFIIIEAESVLGGRIKEMKFGGYTIEVGANWVQGTRDNITGKENPLWTLAKKHKLNTVFSDDEDLVTFDHNGWSDYLDVVEEAYDHFDEVIQDGTIRKERNHDDPSFSHGLKLREWKPQTPHEKAADWWAFDFEYADTPSASSMIHASVNDDATFGQWTYDNRLVVDQRGYATLVREEAKPFITNTNILFNSIVTKILYSDNLVKITLKNRDVIWADYAICTFSVGVLQHDDIKFVPAFPTWKQESIFMFKMATYTKIFLQFPYKFWNNTQYFLYADPYRRGYYPVWQSLSEVGFFPGSNILFTTVVTDQAHIVEAQSNDQTLKEIMVVLKSMFGERIPQPTNFYFYRWTQDPLYRGSYSNWPIGTSQCQHDNLRRSMGRLHFAGEAYSEKYYGFAHGAYLDGLEVGQKIANYMLKKSFKPEHEDYTCARK